MCDCLREHYPDDMEVKLRYLGDLVKLDESCGEVLELVQLSLCAGVTMQLVILVNNVCSQCGLNPKVSLIM